MTTQDADASDDTDNHSLYLSQDDVYTSGVHPVIPTSLPVLSCYDDSAPYSRPLNDICDLEVCRQSCPSSNLQFHPVRLKRKSVCFTYLLTLFLGMFGAHHFYLGRPKFGTLYVFTVGLLGLGYVVDLVRVPWLVESANLEILHPELKGQKYLMDAYLLWMPPFGLLGFHHLYLGNTCKGIVYLVTGGAIVLGWLLDLCLLPLIWVRQANAQYLHYLSTINNNNIEGMEDIPGCAVVASPELYFTSPDGASLSPRTPAGITLTPPPYTETDELASDEWSPPSYADVLAMDAQESRI